jgi:branched-chain amino acid transport system substrate-binding protein
MNFFSRIAVLALLALGLIGSGSTSAEAGRGSPTVLVLLNLSNTLDDTARLGREGVRIALESLHVPAVVKFEIFDIDENVAIAAKQLITEIEKVKPVALIGIMRSDLAFSVADVAEPRKIPFITPLATHPKLTSGKSYVFRTCFDDDRQADLLARFIVQVRKLKRGAILYNQTFSFSLGFQSAFKLALEKVGGAVVLSKPFTAETEIGKDTINRIKASGAQFVLTPSYQLEAAALLTKLSRSLPPSVEFFGPDSWGGGSYFKPVFASNSVMGIAFY